MKMKYAINTLNYFFHLNYFWGPYYVYSAKRYTILIDKGSSILYRY